MKKDEISDNLNLNQQTQSQDSGNNINESLNNNHHTQNKNVEPVINSVENTSSNPPSILQKLRSRSNRPQRIPPKQSDLQVSPSKLETKIENPDVKKNEEIKNNNNQLKLNSKINILKRQNSFKDENQQNTLDTSTSIINDINKINSKKPTEKNTDLSNQIPINPTISNNNNENISRSNSGTQLSAMEKHKLKMKERRSVDKQKKLETTSIINTESKDNKLNDDINKVLGYDEYFENQPAATNIENAHPFQNPNPDTEINPIDAMYD